MCHPAAPMETKRRSIFAHSIRRVPPSEPSSSQRISPYSSALGASARVTVVSIGVGVPTHVSFTVPTAPRFASVTKGAHSRKCTGSVSASHTLSGEWRSSRTRMSVHFSPSFCTRARLAGPGAYSSGSLILPTQQLRELNEVAAVVVQLRNDRASRVGRRHRELRATSLGPLVVALDVIGEEIGGGLPLLENRLLIHSGRGVV